MKYMFFLFFLVSLTAKLPQKVLLCGVCRNVEEPLPSTIKFFEEIGSFFEDYRVIVYENNSTDATARILNQWKEKNKKVYLQSEKVSWSELDKEIINWEKNAFYRPELIARARNIVLKQAMSEAYLDFDYLIWMDMDFYRKPNYKGLLEVFTTSREWDAVFAYGIDPPGTYWDWYAYRDVQYPIGSELLGNYWWYYPKKLQLSPKDDWHQVYSAFGGCAIYKKSAIEGCSYSAIVTPDLAEVVQQIINDPRHENNHFIKKYHEQIGNECITIQAPRPHLQSFLDPNQNFLLPATKNETLLWKMSSFVYQYPSVCEHVTFHASMIARGHDKLFINPRFVVTYGK